MGLSRDGAEDSRARVESSGASVALSSEGPKNMRVYVLKVMKNPVDGWGRNGGLRDETIGIFASRDAAESFALERAKDEAATYCDCSKTWIEEVIVQ